MSLAINYNTGPSLKKAAHHCMYSLPLSLSFLCPIPCSCLFSYPAIECLSSASTVFLLPYSISGMTPCHKDLTFG